MYVSDVVKTCNLPDETEGIDEVRHLVDCDWDVAAVFEGYFVATRLDRNIGLHILQTKQKLRHANTDRMLTDLAHIVEIKFEHSLQFELILEVVDNTGRIANTSLLMNCATDQVLVDVVLQSNGSNVVDVVQSLLYL